MHRERPSQRGRSGRLQGRDTGPGGRGHGRGEDKRGLLKAQGGVRKPKVASVKNQIRSIERLLRKVILSVGEDPFYCFSRSRLSMPTHIVCEQALIFFL
jgi:hypothetical protein